MTNHEYDSIRRASMRQIRQAGQMTRQHFGRAPASRKPDRSYITQIDHAVQDFLLDWIAREFPEDAAISEETQSAPQRHAVVASVARCWVIDPIDGTRSFARGFPGFCVSVALLERGSPVVGWIHNPLTDQMYSAAAGAGVWRDDQPIRAPDEPLSSETILAIPSSHRGPMPPAVHGWIDRMVVRNVGSTALHLALLSCGALDAVFADECRLWDIAAGELILREAGGKLVSLDGGYYFPMNLSAYNGEITPFLAAGPRALTQLLTEYRQ